jgi:hypothetical protein
MSRNPRWLFNTISYYIQPIFIFKCKISLL